MRAVHWTACDTPHERWRAVSISGCEGEEDPETNSVWNPGDRPATAETRLTIDLSDEGDEGTPIVLDQIEDGIASDLAAPDLHGVGGQSSGLIDPTALPGYWKNRDKTKPAKRHPQRLDADPWNWRVLGERPPEQATWDTREWGSRLREGRVFYTAERRMFWWRVAVWIGFLIPYALFWYGLFSGFLLDLVLRADPMDQLTRLLSILFFTYFIATALSLIARTFWARQRDFLLSHGRSVSSSTDWLAVVTAVVIPFTVLIIERSLGASG